MQNRYRHFLILSIVIIYLISLIFILFVTPIFHKVSAQTPLTSKSNTESYQFITQWGSQGTGIGQFNNPSGIAAGSNGNVYVVDSGNNRIEVFTPVSISVQNIKSESINNENSISKGLKNSNFRNNTTSFPLKNSNGIFSKNNNSNTNNNTTFIIPLNKTNAALNNTNSSKNIRPSSLALSENKNMNTNSIINTNNNTNATSIGYNKKTIPNNQQETLSIISRNSTGSKKIHNQPHAGVSDQF